jgi:hypothetical protein
MITTQKNKTHCIWQWVRLKLKTGRLSPNARTNACATATHAGATTVHLDQAAHSSVFYPVLMPDASESFIKSELTGVCEFGYKHCTMVFCCQIGRMMCCCCCGAYLSGIREIVG